MGVSDPATLPSARGKSDLLSHEYFDSEAKGTIDLLIRLRELVGRTGRCDLSVYEDMRNVHRAVRALFDKAELASYSQYLMPQIFNAEPPSCNRKGTVRKGRKPRVRPAAASVHTKSRNSEELKGIYLDQSLERPSADSSVTPSQMHRRGQSPSTEVVWLDLVRRVPDISMEDLCRKRISSSCSSASTAETAHYRSAASTPCPLMPARPSTCSPVPERSCWPPLAPREHRSFRGEGPRAASIRRMQDGLPRRPATSMGTCIGDDVNTSSMDCAEHSGDEDCPADDGVPWPIRGVLHVEVFVEVRPAETEARQALLELQVRGDEPLYPSISSTRASPPKFSHVIAGRSAHYGTVLLDVRNADAADLRVSLIGASSHEVYGLRVSRMIDQVPAAPRGDLSAQDQEPSWMPFQWHVDDRRVVHLRTSFRHGEQLPQMVSESAQQSSLTTQEPSMPPCFSTSAVDCNAPGIAVQQHAPGSSAASSVAADCEWAERSVAAPGISEPIVAPPPDAEIFWC